MFCALRERKLTTPCSGALYPASKGGDWPAICTSRGDPRASSRAPHADRQEQERDVATMANGNASNVTHWQRGQQRGL
eukprot:1839269-Prymnesium_polylepis.1